MPFYFYPLHHLNSLSLIKLSSNFVLNFGLVNFVRDLGENVFHISFYPSQLSLQLFSYLTFLQFTLTNMGLAEWLNCWLNLIENNVTLCPILQSLQNNFPAGLFNLWIFPTNIFCQIIHKRVILCQVQTLFSIKWSFKFKMQILQKSLNKSGAFCKDQRLLIMDSRGEKEEKIRSNLMQFSQYKICFNIFLIWP